MGDPESIRVPLPGTSVQPTSDNEPTLFKILQGGDILATDGYYAPKNSEVCSKVYTISNNPPPEMSNVAKPAYDNAESNLTQKMAGNTEVIRIQVIQSLGNGGFGSVFKCIKTQKGSQGKQDICLKLCHQWDFEDKADPEINKHIIREIQTFQKFEDDTHENIIQFYFACYCAKTERVFLGLEFFSGCDLSKFIRIYQKAKKRFPAEHINCIIIGVVNAVMHVQKKWLVHCDIKPHNVMFNCFNEKVKLIDFGCAVDVDDDSTTFGGTSEYMAPEMLRNHDVKSVKVDSTDVYGIGALLYHLLTLERPWLDHLDVREAFRNPKRRGVRRAILKAMRDKKPWTDECGNMCSYTHLQAKMRDYRLQHYQHYPDHCDIACAMLESEPDMRLNCQQVLRRLEKNCMCADSRQQRRKEVKQKAAATLGSSHDPHQQLVEDFIANPNIPLLLENLHFASSSNRVTSAPNTLMNQHKKLLLERLSAQTSASTRTSTSHSGKVRQREGMDIGSHSSHEECSTNNRNIMNLAQVEDAVPPVNKNNPIANDVNINITPGSSESRARVAQAVCDDPIRETPKAFNRPIAYAASFSGSATPEEYRYPHLIVNHSTPVAQGSLGARPRVRFGRQRSTPSPEVNQDRRPYKTYSALSAGLGDDLMTHGSDLSYVRECHPDDESPLEFPNPEYEGFNEIEWKLREFIERLPSEEYGAEHGMSDRSVRFIPGGDTTAMSALSIQSRNSSAHSTFPSPSQMNLERLAHQNSARSCTRAASGIYNLPIEPHSMYQDDYDELD